MKPNLKMFLFLICAFLIGAVVMSLEMLVSRYLNPYFGGTIFTWAALISVVLLAMMLGYFLGGWVADKVHWPFALEIMIAVSGLYLLVLPGFVDVVLEFVVLSFEDLRIGALLGTFITTFVPVTLLSTYTPNAVKTLLTSLEFSGRVPGLVFAISTAGNIVGTLATSFLLIPRYGTRSLTQFLALTLFVTVAILLFARRKNTANPSATILPLLILSSVIFSLQLKPAVAQPAIEIITSDAAYPEGPLLFGGYLYYAEMTRDRIVRTRDGRRTEFFRRKGCGPTSIAPFKSDGFLVTCHLSDELAELTADGHLVRTIDTDARGRRILKPNDSHSDRKGGVYVSSSGLFHIAYQPMGILYHLAPDGRVSRIDEKLFYPNGVYVTTDGTVFLSEHLAQRILKYEIAADMSVSQKRIFTDTSLIGGYQTVPPDFVGPDGLEITADGRVLVAEYGAGRILMFGPDGALTATINTPQKYVTSLALTGDQASMIVTGAHEITSELSTGSVVKLPLPRRGE